MNKMVYIVNIWESIPMPLKKICTAIFSIIAFVASIFGIVQFFFPSDISPDEAWGIICKDKASIGFINTMFIGTDMENIPVCVLRNMYNNVISLNLKEELKIYEAFKNNITSYKIVRRGIANIISDDSVINELKKSALELLDKGNISAARKILKEISQKLEQERFLLEERDKINFEYLINAYEAEANAAQLENSLSGYSYAVKKYEEAANLLFEKKDKRYTAFMFKKADALLSIHIYFSEKKSIDNACSILSTLMQDSNLAHSDYILQSEIINLYGLSYSYKYISDNSYINLKNILETIENRYHNIPQQYIKYDNYETLGIICSTLGDFTYKKNFYHDAIQYYNKALSNSNIDIIKSNTIKQNQALCYISLAKITHDKKYVEKSIDLLSKLSVFFKEKKYVVNAVTCILNLGVAYSAISDITGNLDGYKKSISCFEGALKYSTINNMSYQKQHIYAQYGISLFYLGYATNDPEMLNEAIIKSNTAISINKKNLYEIATAKLTIANAICAIGDISKNINKLEDAINIYRDLIKSNKNNHKITFYVHSNISTAYFILSGLTREKKYIYAARKHINYILQELDKNTYLWKEANIRLHKYNLAIERWNDIIFPDINR